MHVQDFHDRDHGSIFVVFENLVIVNNRLGTNEFSKTFLYIITFSNCFS